MTRRPHALNWIACIALSLLACMSNADEYPVGNLRVLEPWSQELPPNAPTVAAYFIIRNEGMNADRLLSVDSPIAKLAQLHRHLNQDGMMSMQPVDSVEIAPGSQVTFAPMGYHVMLLELQDRSALRDGQRFPLTLHFEQAGDITLNVAVHARPPASHQDQPAH